MARSNTGNRKRDIDKKWNDIFNDYNVLELVESEGLFRITASQIREYKEARLMTKFDYQSSLPDLFIENNLSILPTRRGEYVIGNFEAYEQISNNNSDFRNNRKEQRFPSWIETLDYSNITSESTMLNASAISGMIHDMFSVENVFQTISGRMGSDVFDFKINDTLNPNRQYNLNVTNSQIEVDAGFETENNLILIEAKNNTTSSFLIRQLYYPYRLWSHKVHKPIIPVFLQYSNGVYNFSEYRFNDINDYNSLELVRRKNYLISSEEELTTSEIIYLIQNTKIVEEPNTHDIPFPQADDLNKIIDLMNALYTSESGLLSLEDITLTNDFTMRQAHYYSRAALYLELVRIKGDEIHLSLLGERMMHLSKKDRDIRLIKSIFKHEPFKVAMMHRLRARQNLSAREIAQVLMNNNLLRDYSPVTIERRSQTINSWIRTVLAMSNEY